MKTENSATEALAAPRPKTPEATQLIRKAQDNIIERFNVIVRTLDRLERRMTLRTPMKSLPVLAAALFLNGTAAFAAIDSGLLNVAPPDAKVLTGLQVDQTLLSPFGQYILNQFQPN